ncbi:MAG: helix-turn-helix domain-containing protein [Clostridia bacterium]|nr:helix-turn-helix domain-containing protein [Clostridia bacterium]MDE7216268.1 helix-turn-helix domain-containing protein [Clostridia bacterium]
MKYFYFKAMEKKEKLFISIYNDYYGSLLTEYQKGLIDGYYNLDMSLSELAEENGISPQGVRDAIKRAEKQLTVYEEKLGLVKKSQKIKELLEEVMRDCPPDKKEKLRKAVEILID